MAWQTPVFNRTQKDIYRAKDLINKIKQYGYNSLSSEEKSEWDSGLKGCRNASDLNRIENNCEYLGDELDLDLDLKNDWDYGTTPLYEDILRILSNINEIKNNLPTPIPDIPITPDPPINTIDKLNDIELILKLVYDSLQN